MIKTLEIRNLAIISEMQLEFPDGFIVFTGETGAGKSIIVEAMGLLLGNRADASLISPKANAAELSATLKVSNSLVAMEALSELEIEPEEGNILLRRKIHRGGASRSWINATPVSVQTLRQIGAPLVEIHGQHSHLSLLDIKTQRRWLDACGKHGGLLSQLCEQESLWRQAHDWLAADSDTKGVELLRYQLQELSELDPNVDEYPQLMARHRALQKGQEITDKLLRAKQILHDGEDACTDRLSALVGELRRTAQLDIGIVTLLELLEGALAQLEESRGELRALLERDMVDERALAEIEARLQAWYGLADKHRVAQAALYGHMQTLKARAAQAEDAEQERILYKKQEEEALQAWRRLAAILHGTRCETASKLQDEVGHWLRKLGMPKGLFRIEVHAKEDNLPQSHGMDRIAIAVSLNPGQPPLPLHKVVSGGELSRIGLAMRIVGAQDKGTPAMICDEVDAGIGGETSEIVGRLLAELARHRQVFCVSHLPQIAAYAGHHCHIEKIQESSCTWIRVQVLDEEGRIEEIARMLGGRRLGESAREHARSLLAVSKPAN
ncbi:MAG: DNA repair protein RecN [Candidatus Eutrophobiaceae bacterium]